VIAAYVQRVGFDPLAPVDPALLGDVRRVQLGQLPPGGHDALSIGRWK
jgi:hypothetical protein